MCDNIAGANAKALRLTARDDFGCYSATFREAGKHKTNLPATVLIADRGKILSYETNHRGCTSHAGHPYGVGQEHFGNVAILMQREVSCGVDEEALGHFILRVLQASR
jgi:hypothetical protein